jgi:hypothetical protein
MKVTAKKEIGQFRRKIMGIGDLFRNIGGGRKGRDDEWDRRDDRQPRDDEEEDEEDSQYRYGDEEEDEEDSQYRYGDDEEDS